MHIRILLALLLLGAAAFAQSENAAPSVLNQGKYVPDIATFLNIGACSPAGVTWDGKTVFFTSNMSGASQVYRLTEEGWPYQLTTFEDGVAGFTLSWGGAMAIVSAAVGGDENAQLYLMDTQSGRLVPLTKNPKVMYGSVVWTRDDKAIYYRSNAENLKDFFIYRMELADGSSKKIFGDTASVRGQTAIADLSEDGTKLMLANYSSNVNSDLYLLDLTTGKWEKLTPHTGDVMYGSVSLLPDNRTIWLTSNDNKDGLSRPATMTSGSLQN